MTIARRRRYRPHYCGALGLQSAARKAIREGKGGLFTDPDDWEDWIEDVLEGEERDTLLDVGWRNSCGALYCRRAGACKRDLRHNVR